MPFVPANMPGPAAIAVVDVILKDGCILNVRWRCWSHFRRQLSRLPPKHEVAKQSTPKTARNIRSRIGLLLKKVLTQLLHERVSEL